MSIFDIMSQQPSPSLGGTGGIGALGPGNAIYPQSRMDKTQYATPMQLPTSADVISSDYDPKTDAYTGMPSRFAKGGIAKFETGGGITDILANSGDSTEAKKATITKLYKNILGRDPKEGEDIMQWADSLDPSNPTQSVLTLADRLAQTEEGTEYGKKNPKEVFKTMAALSQNDSPFAGMDTPYSNMRYIGASNKTNYGGETTPDSTSVTHMFQDENGGVVSVDQYGQPTQYAPGRGWYDEQFKKHPDALRNYGYRNQTYLASGPLDKTYNLNGVDVPVLAQEYQVDPESKKLATNKLGEYKPLELKPQDYDWFNDWGGPAMVVAVPLAAAGGAALAGGAAAGTAAGGATAGTVAGGTAAGTTGALTTAELMGGAGGAFAPTAGSGASFAIPAGAYTAAGAGAGAGAAGSGSWGLSPQLAAELGLEGSTSGLSTSGTLGSQTLESMGLNTAAAKGMTTGQKLIALNLATKALGGASGGSGGGGYTTTQSAPTQSVASNQFQPSMMPAMFAMSQSSTPGSYYQPYVYNYGSRHYAQGGVADLGGYAAGGKLLRGAGDGMSDDIVANIEGQQPARLADGEFVIPADVVSHLGNGSTDAGAKQLYKMMDRIRQARTGKKSQGKKINPEKFFPKG